MASVGEISGEKLGKLGVTIDEEEFGGAVRVWHCYKFNSYNSNNPASFCRGQSATSALPANLYSWLTETICGRKLRLGATVSHPLPRRDPEPLNSCPTSPCLLTSSPVQKIPPAAAPMPGAL